MADNHERHQALEEIAGFVRAVQKLNDIAVTEYKVLVEDVIAGRITDEAWTHMNIWECPYYLRCRELEAEQVWLQIEKGFVRCVRARFKDLELQSIISDEWRPFNSGFWGYPHMLEYEEPYVYSRLLVSEEAFKTKKLALKNAQTNQPGLCMDEVCDEMFGDG